MGEPDPASAAVRGVGAANADEAGRGKGGIGAVGYSIRFDDRTGPRTRIKFLTDGMVLREMLGSDSAVAAGRLGVGAEDGDTGRQDKGKGKAKVDGINGHAEQGSAEEEGAVSKEPAVTAPANGKAKRNSGLGLLSRYSVLVIDEAHERTLRTDMVLGCVKRIQAMRKKKRAAWIARGSPDGETVTELKVVVMSATLDASAFSTFFDGAPVLYVRGRQHGVATYHTPQPCLDWSDAALRAVLQIHVSRAPGDMLVFMTGQEEIESLARSLAHYAPQLSSLQRPEGASAPLELLVTPIYAALGPAAGARVFAPTPPRTRKVVLATNIAETSITIPGIKYVVDCGLAKEKAFTPSTGVETLAVRPISQSAAAQRAGRAGREGPGECYRLYTEAAHDDLEKAPTPEIIRTDLAAATLQLVALGRDPWHFDWMDAPDAEALQHACIGLVQLGAVTLTCEKDDKIEEEGADSDEENKDITGPMPPIRITALGKRMANLPLDPAYARILLAASDVSPVVARQARDLVALLSADRGVFVEPHDANKRDDATRAKAAFAHPSGDHATLLKVLAAFRAADASARATARGAAISAAGANGNANGKRAHSDAQAARAELKAWCETHFVHERAMRNVLSIRTQLARLCVQAGIVCDDASDFAPRSRDPSSALPASDPVSDDEAEIESEGESSARAGLWVSRNGNRAQRDEEQDKEEDYVELRRCFLEGRFTHLALRQPDGTYKRLQTSQVSCALLSPIWPHLVRILTDTCSGFFLARS